MSENPIRDNDIAIIGMAGRFPGANNINEFWNNLIAGKETIKRFTQEEISRAGLPSTLLNDTSFVPARGILDRVDFFDAPFFSYSPREAELIDPQQRILLECAWSAIEEAGYDPNQCADQTVGVFAGSNQNTYQLFHLLHSDEALTHVHGMAIYSDKDFIATRISHKLNLKGPSFSIQCACSTSLVCVHLACQSLLAFECDMALAGGVSVVFPQTGYFYQAGGVFSPDGHCRAFDQEAAGTLGGDGVGMVLLKRLKHALNDGDHIHAIIRGTAVNNDGSEKASYAAPSVDGQMRVILEALSVADVDAQSIRYVETHGTGTPLGDLVEITALTNAFQAMGCEKNLCAIGSLKPNIGHLDQAAGIANLIKASLMLKHGLIPPSLHFNHPNPEIDFVNSPFHVNTKLTPWPKSSSPKRASVSCFGFGGTNAHLVLEEASHQKSSSTTSSQLLLFSARSHGALEAYLNLFIHYFKKEKNLNLADVSYVLKIGRSRFQKRCFLVASSIDEALDILINRDPSRLITEENTNENSNEPLINIGKLWLNGADIDWKPFYKNEKRNRLPLPTYPFEGIQYLIPPRPLGESGINLQKIKRESNDQWLYLPQWSRTSFPENRITTAPSSWLILASDTALIEALREQLQKQGIHLSIAMPGELFEENNLGEFTLRPNQSDDFKQMLTQLHNQNRWPERILHAVSVSLKRDEHNDFKVMQTLGLESLLALTHALVKMDNTEKKIDLLVTTQGAQDVMGNEKLITNSATMLGFFRVVTQEYPFIICRTVDFEIAVSHAEFIKQLSNEWCAEKTNTFIGYRGSNRFRQTFERYDEHTQNQASLIKPESVILITGGLGAIGQRLALYLARTYQARLVLVSRTELPPQETWKDWIKKHGESHPKSHLLRQLQGLFQAGGQCLLATADVADANQMKDVFEKAKHVFGEIDGVIHAAGISGSDSFHGLIDTTPEILAEHFRSKVNGVKVLETLINNEPNIRFCILQSSLFGIVGGPGSLAYAAATRFMDQTANHQKNHHCRWISIAWDAWLPEDSTSTGLSDLAITSEEACQLFEKILTMHGINYVIVSTSDLQSRIKRWTQTLNNQSTEHSACYERPQLKSSYTSAESEIEQLLTNLWQTILGIHPIGIDDDFFELGGHSLFAMQVVSRIKDSFPIEFQLHDLVDHPTISQLAAMVEHRLLLKIETMSEEEVMQMAENHA